MFLLLYYDPIRMHIVDPMHNLMLGIAKYAFMARDWSSFFKSVAVDR